jgi:pimeloyl-ACP methyl ester carboxylesterase
MSTPHERLIRTTFSLPFGEVHALVGGAVNARPLLFLHGFPDHPPTAVPFLEHLAETHRVVAPWLRGYAPSPIVGPYDLDTLAADALALIDRLGDQVDLVGHDWGGEITYTVCAAAPSHVRRAVTLAIPHPDPHTLARLLEAVEEELVHGVVPAPRSRLSRAPTRARADRSPVARLVAELHARLRAP